MVVFVLIVVFVGDELVFGVAATTASVSVVDEASYYLVVTQLAILCSLFGHRWTVMVARSCQSSIECSIERSTTRCQMSNRWSDAEKIISKIFRMETP